MSSLCPKGCGTNAEEWTQMAMWQTMWRQSSWSMCTATLCPLCRPGALCRSSGAKQGTATIPGHAWRKVSTATLSCIYSHREGFSQPLFEDNRLCSSRGYMVVPWKGHSIQHQCFIHHCSVFEHLCVSIIVQQFNFCWLGSGEIMNCIWSDCCILLWITIFAWHIDLLLAVKRDSTYFSFRVSRCVCSKWHLYPESVRCKSLASFRSPYVSGEKETMSYFAAHFEEQLKLYQKQVSHHLNAWVCDWHIY